MKYEEIQALLDRYWEGETSIQEEAQIKAYFKAGPIDERLRKVAPLFQALREEQALQSSFKAKAAPMRPQIYQWAAAASVALLMVAGWWMLRDEKIETPMVAEVPVQAPKGMEQPMAEVTLPIVVPEKKIALASTNPRKKNLNKRVKPIQEIDPETAQAMAEIKAALALVSSKLDKGRAQAIKGAAHLDALDKVPKRDDRG